MKKILALLVAAFWLTVSFAQQGPTLAVQTWTFHQYSLIETIHKADSLGIRYLEVYPGQRVGADIAGTFSYTLSTTDRKRIKEILRVKGIQVIALGVIDHYYYDTKNLEKFFAFAADMGIPFLTAEPEWKDLDLFNQLAAKYKIKVALHCHPLPTSHYWHPDSTYQAIQGREHLGAWPDIGHWARNGVKITDGLRLLKGKIWGMHFKDVDQFGNTKANDVLFGKGICDLPAVMKELQRQTFKGVVCMEYEANEFNNMNDMRKNKRFTEKLIRKFISHNK